VTPDCGRRCAGVVPSGSLAGKALAVIAAEESDAPLSAEGWETSAFCPNMNRCARNVENPGGSTRLNQRGVNVEGLFVMIHNHIITELLSSRW
jgi:hypothetical protein